MKKYFRFDILGTDYKRETLGVLTTFFAPIFKVVSGKAKELSAGT